MNSTTIRVAILREKPRKRDNYSESYRKKLAAMDQAEELIRSQFKVVRPNKADYLLVLGGDGAMTRMAKRYYNLGVPMFGINFGSRGFLLNEQVVLGNLAEAIVTAEWIDFPLLEAEVHLQNGTIKKVLAFNDVFTNAANKKNFQSAKHRLFINGHNVLGRTSSGREIFYSGDGLIVCTAGGSTAYNKAAGGPIMNHKDESLGLTPVCPNWPTENFKPQMIPGDCEITIEMIEDDKRQHVVCADSHTFTRVNKVVIRKTGKIARLGFRRDDTYMRKTLVLRFPWLDGQDINDIKM